MADAAAQDMDVGVDETGQHCFAAEVQDLGSGAFQPGDVTVAAYGDEPAMTHGQGLRPGPVRVDGDDVGIANYRVRVSG